MRSASVWVLAAIGCLVAAGCSLPERVPFQERPEIRAIREKFTEPADVVVALAAPRQPASEPAPEESGERFRSRPNPSRFRSETLEAIASTRAVKGAVAVGSEGGTSSLESLLAESRDARADILVIPEVRRYENVFVRFNSWWIPNVFLWFYLWIPSWWVRDEVYGTRIEASFEFYDVHSGRKVRECVVAGEVQESFNDLERGSIFAGIFRVPGALDQDNWRLVDDVLGPRAMDELESGFVRELTGGLLPEIGTEEYRQKSRKVLALVVGVEDYQDSRLERWRKYCDRDADAVARFLTSRAGWNLPPYNVRLLKNEHARRDRILEALSRIGDRARPADTVLLYFAGLGFASHAGAGEAPASAEGGSEEGAAPAGAEGAGTPEGTTPAAGAGVEVLGAFLPYDATFDAPRESGIALAELAAAVERIPAGRVVLILDTAFDAGGGERSLTREKARTEPLPFGKEFPWNSFSRRKGLTLIVSSSPGEGAMSIPSEKAGLFTWFLLESLGRGKALADTSKDGVVSLEEAFVSTRERMRKFLCLGKAAQTPASFGEPGRDLAMTGAGAGACTAAAVASSGPGADGATPGDAAKAPAGGQDRARKGASSMPEKGGPGK